MFGDSNCSHMGPIVDGNPKCSTSLDDEKHLILPFVKCGALTVSIASHQLDT